MQNDPMKILCLLIVMLPMVSNAQILTASNEPTQIYFSINNALTHDRPGDAVAEFSKVVEFFKEEGRDKQLPEAYFAMALGLALNGYYKESIRYHKKALRAHRKYRDDEPLEIEMNLGLTYTLAGKTKKAKKILGQVNTQS
jgi:tetratricopeptide (TPR) repeat protein